MRPVTIPAPITEDLEDLRSEARRVCTRATSTLVREASALGVRASLIVRRLSTWRSRVTLGPTREDARVD